MIEFDIDEAAWAGLPRAEQLVRDAASAAFDRLGVDTAGKVLSISLADDDTVAELNRQWRGKAKPTNVLSFPAGQDMAIPPGEPRPLGDIILASGVVAAEAEAQSKRIEDHFTHLVVHGILHIMGYDHLVEAEAEEMESLEKDILAKLGVADPYD